MARTHPLGPISKDNQEVHFHGNHSLLPERALESPRAANCDVGHIMSVPWAMEMNGISKEGPERLVQTLTGAILGCGGWVLSRGANDAGTVNILFEFERQACVEIYTVLAATGVELSRSGHIWFTELCQCTRVNRQDCGTEIVSVELEIHTFPQVMVLGSQAGLVT